MPLKLRWLWLIQLPVLAILEISPILGMGSNKNALPGIKNLADCSMKKTECFLDTIPRKIHSLLSRNPVGNCQLLKPRGSGREKSILIDRAVKR